MRMLFNEKFASDFANHVNVASKLPPHTRKSYCQLVFGESIDADFFQQDDN